MDREAGKDLLMVDGLSKTVNGEKLLNNISFTMNHDDKIAIIGENELAVTALMQILAEEDTPDEGTVKWGVSTSRSYFPKDNSKFFDGCSLNLMDWLRQFSPEGFETQNESYIRGFLGRMLFSGEDVYKEVQVLSGGEKVRCMLSRMMLYGSNVLLLDQPTNHLDLESITAVNNGLTAFKGNVIFACHDHEFVNTVANRIIDIQADGTIVDRMCTYDEYIEMRKNK
jgi:ATPase subunit of ABC transporter with duplicated ATPase domains